MTVTLTEQDKKEILEKLTIDDCNKFIEEFKDDIERVKQNDPEDFFDIKGQRSEGIEYYKQAIDLLKENDNKESSKVKSYSADKLNTDISDKDMKLTIKIMLRVIDTIINVEKENLSAKKISKFIELLHIDIMVVHLNGCPLDFDKLFNSDSEHFYKDMAGIFENINRETGKLENGFRPRCAL